MHTLQKLLITRLVKENGLKYSELTRGYDYEDNIVFHLKQLTSKGLIEKKNGKYFVTSSGLKTLNSFQKTNLQDDQFKMTFYGFVCKEGDNYLLKPHEGKETFYNLPSGSPLFGEKYSVALTRVFNEETGIKVDYERFQFDSVHLKTVVTSEGKVIFDDAFIVFNIILQKTECENMILGKGSEWYHVKEIETLENKWPEIDYCVLRNDWSTFKQYEVLSDYILY